MDTDVTDTILQLKDGEEADEGINLSYIVIPSTYLHIIDRDGEQRNGLRKKNKYFSNKTETVTITFEKDGKTAVTDIAVTKEGMI